ncbi:hypothetical protein QQ045_009130 [Rhodiola kirilowii]
MARTLKNSLKLFLKLVNAVFGAIGLFFLVFGLWLLRVWQREVADGSTSSYPVPWSLYQALIFPYCHKSTDSSLYRFDSSEIEKDSLRIILRKNIPGLLQGCIRVDWVRCWPVLDEFLRTHCC